MFRVSQHSSSGVLITVTATSGTGHNTGTVTSLQRGLQATLEGNSILLHLVGFLLTLNCDGLNHELKIYYGILEVRMEFFIFKTNTLLNTVHKFLN